MGLRIKKVWLLILTIIICIYCFVGCFEKKNPVEAKYDTLPFGDYVIQDMSSLDSKLGEGYIFLLASFEDYENLKIPFVNKNESFFDENALLIIRYEHSSSDEPIDLVDIAIKDDKIYPVVSMDLPPDHDICTDFHTALIIADVKKSDVEKYSFGEVLALNLADKNDGSVHHKKFE